MPPCHPSAMQRQRSLWSALPLLLALLLLLSLAGRSSAEPLRVGISNLPPLAFTASDGTPRGLFIELLDAIAHQEDWQLEYVAADLDRLQQLAELGEVDLIAPFAYTDERATRFDYTEQFVLLDWGVLVHPPGGHLDTLPELQGKRIAVVRGSVFTPALRKHLDAFHIDATLVELEDYEQVAAAVAGGQFAVGVIDNTRLRHYQKHYHIETTSLIFAPAHLSVATREGHRPELLRTIDRHLLRLKADPHSILFQLQEKWLAESYPHERRYLVWGGVLVLALLAVGGRAYALRRQVRDKLARLAATNHELKTSREELHRLNQQFQALLDGIPEYLMLVSPQMRVEWMNKAARTAVAEHVRKDGDDVAPCFREWARRSGPCAGCPVAACFASGQSQETVMQSGATVFGVKAFPIFAADGRVESVIKLAIDITEKMRRREDDDRKNRLAAIGTLAAGVAHEINNPSGLILSNLELISEAFDDAAPLLDEQFKRDGDFFFAGLPFSRMRSQLPILLKESADAARRIRQTVTDLKDFSRDGGTRDFTDFSLTTAVERSLRLTDQLLRKSTAHFSLDLAAQEITLHGNARRIEQVLVNLLANACQALPDRSRAIVLTTGYDTDLQQATIVVRDEGIGIAAEDLPKLATPFFTTRQHEGGTGLGLSVSFGIIKEHGGTIHFDSPPGKGATVTVTLPATVTKITP